MITLYTCSKCGLQFEGSGPNPRCPSCHTRIADEGSSSPPGAAYAFDFRSGRGFRAMAWQGAGRSVLLVIAAVLLLPVLLGGGLIALIIGAVFGIGWLATVGAVMSALGAAALLFVLWKLLSALRTAAGAFQGSDRPWREEDDSIEGRWEQR